MKRSAKLLLFAFAFPPQFSSELPAIAPQRHLGQLDVQLHRVVRWAVPPVGDRLLVARGDVRQVLPSAVKVSVLMGAPC